MSFQIPEEWVLILIPLAFVWLSVIVDIIRQSGLTTRAKWIWAALVTFVWPLMIVYWLTRPVSGRAVRATDRDDPQARLVDGALDHEDGRIDDLQMAALKSDLRGHARRSAAPRQDPPRA